MTGVQTCALPISGELLTNEVFRWQPENDGFGFLGRSFVYDKIAKATGRTVEAFDVESRRKERYLQAMDAANLSYYRDVSRAIAAYYIDPEAALHQLEAKTAR